MHLCRQPWDEHECEEDRRDAADDDRDREAPQPREREQSDYGGDSDARSIPTAPG